jgi:hypothetical protein
MSKVRCVDVVALFAAAILRRNPASVVIPFDDKPYRAQVDPQDSILSLSADPRCAHAIDQCWRQRGKRKGSVRWIAPIHARWLPWISTALALALGSCHDFSNGRAVINCEPLPTRNRQAVRVEA